MKLVSLPFHWVHPSAPAKYVGCRVSIPAYDPDTPERSTATVKAARVASFNAAVGAVGGKPYRGPKLPRSVLVPTQILNMTWQDFGRGKHLAGLSLMKLGFRRFQVEDLATMPFARCPSEHVNRRTIRKLENLAV